MIADAPPALVVPAVPATPAATATPSGSLPIARASSPSGPVGPDHRHELPADAPAWRRHLHDTGVDLKLAYQSESAASFTGGARGGSAYTQQLLASVRVDTGKAIGIKGGVFTFSLLHRKGVDLTATRLGNLFEVQELYGGGQDLRPAEITWEQNLGSGRTSLKIGLYNSGADFATLPSGCNFQNFAFCPRPTTLFYNSGFSGFPVPRWGARIRQRIAPGWYLTAAAFEVNSYRAQTGNGWKLLPRFDSGVFPVEIMWKSGRKPGQLPGLLRFGALVDSTDKPDVLQDANGANYSLSGLPPAMRQERWSAWVMGEKAVMHLGRSGAGTLNLFGTFTTSDLHTARVPYFASGGIFAKGFWDQRPDDTAGIGLVYARINPRTTERERALAATGANTPIQTYEMSGEIYYGLQLGPWLLRPNLQYIHHVGGTGRYADAVVGGCTIKLTV